MECIVKIKNRVFCIVLWSMLVMSFPVALAQNGTEAALKEQGKTLCYAGHYAEAVPYLQKAIRQSRRSGAHYYLAICLQHLYDFDGALEEIEAYHDIVNAPMWKERCDSIAAECRMGQRALEHVEDVVIIDSMTVSKADFLDYYRLGAESGRMVRAESGLCYENQAGDYRIEGNGQTFMERHKFQDKWDEAHPLKGIGSEQYRVDYPWQRSDGETIYFACDSTPGIGGLDIYRTTYNSDEGCYYQPERLGMPFNSPYNDYMLAIDETHQVGWWATDRNAGEGEVTIYRFLLDDETQYLDESEVSRARIDCIRDTWRKAEGYADLLQEIAQAPQTPIAVKPRLYIVINDAKVYHDESEFRSPQALENYRKSVALAEQIAQAEAALTTLRGTYHQSSRQQKTALTNEILRQESTLAELYRKQRQAVFDYRWLEQ